MAETTAPAASAEGQKLLVALSWLYVGIPLLWGVARTVINSAALFR